MSIFSFLFGSKQDVNFKELLQSGAIIVDVRTPQEFAQGHIKNAINVPLQTIFAKVQELKKKNKVIITCCRSGARSESAKSILKNSGLEVYNGGGWESLQSKIQ